MIHTLGAVDLTPEMAQMLLESIQVTCTRGSTGQMELFSISDAIGAWAHKGTREKTGICGDSIFGNIGGWKFHHLFELSSLIWASKCCIICKILKSVF